jgi:hypothetical protein
MDAPRATDLARAWPNAGNRDTKIPYSQLHRAIRERAMKTTSILVPLLVVAAAQTALAEEAKPAVIEIDCAHIDLPTQQDFARLAAIDNFTLAYNMRTRTMVRVQRSCQANGGTLLLVIEPTAPTLDRRVAIR